MQNSKGTGSVYFDAVKKSWIAEIQYTNSGGCTKRKKISGKKKNEVIAKLEDFKKQLLLQSGNVAEKGILFQEFADHWLHTVLQTSLKPTSYTRKEVTLQNQVYPEIGNIPISCITHADIQNMVIALQAKKLSYSTIKKAYEAVNGCMRAYRIQTGASFNPCEGITLPSSIRKEIGDIYYFNEIQRDLIQRESTRKHENGHAVYRMGQAIVVLMYTGMRIGELLALEWPDVDFRQKTISITKNAVVIKKDGHYILETQKSTKTLSGARVIPMSKKAESALLEIRKENGRFSYVICSKSGNQISPRNINRMFHSILTQAGIAVNIDDLCGVHTLRHTFASMLFQNGCEVKVVSELLGHSDTKITENTYIHLLQKQRVKAIQDIDKYSN